MKNMDMRSGLVFCFFPRKIRPLVLTIEEVAAFLPTLKNRPNFLVWERQGDE
jgi:hypothetical protein